MDNQFYYPDLRFDYSSYQTEFQMISSTIQIFKLTNLEDCPIVDYADDHLNNIDNQFYYPDFRCDYSGFPDISIDFLRKLSYN